MAKVILCCPRCGTEFAAPRCDAARRKYCSPLCRNGVPVFERFWRYVQRGPGCWLWQGGKDNKGYGALHASAYVDRAMGRRAGSHFKAHRVSWSIHWGPVPQGLCVLHKCDTPPCVNPFHLFLGTQADNVHDMESKGRGRHVGAKLTRDDVIEIRHRRAAGETNSALAIAFGVSVNTISSICTRRTWKNV